MNCFPLDRPAIVVPVHFGNYDIVRAGLLAYGFDVGALYRPLNHPYYHESYLKTISTIDTPLFERGRPVLWREGGQWGWFHRRAQRAFSSLKTVKRLLPMFDALQARAEALSKPTLTFTGFDPTRCPTGGGKSL